MTTNKQLLEDPIRITQKKKNLTNTFPHLSDTSAARQFWNRFAGIFYQWDARFKMWNVNIFTLGRTKLLFGAHLSSHRAINKSGRRKSGGTSTFKKRTRGDFSSNCPTANLQFAVDPSHAKAIIAPKSCKHTFLITLTLIRLCLHSGRVIIVSACKTNIANNKSNILLRSEYLLKRSWLCLFRKLSEHRSFPIPIKRFDWKGGRQVALGHRHALTRLHILFEMHFAVLLSLRFNEHYSTGHSGEIPPRVSCRVKTPPPSKYMQYLPSAMQVPCT